MFIHFPFCNYFVKVYGVDKAGNSGETYENNSCLTAAYTNDYCKKSTIEEENKNLNNIITEYEKKSVQNKSDNLKNSDNADINIDGTACFDILAINYNEPEESIYSTGELFLIFKNYKTEYGTHLFKILDHSMTINKIEKLSDNVVEKGDIFKVSTFLPGGGTYYKFTFEDGKLLKYAMDMPEGNFDNSPEYYLEESSLLSN